MGRYTLSVQYKYYTSADTDWSLNKLFNLRFAASQIEKMLLLQEAKQTGLAFPELLNKQDDPNSSPSTADEQQMRANAICDIKNELSLEVFKK